MADATHSGGKAVAPDADGRTACLARDADGDALGAAVFLDSDDLRELLGTDPHTTDADRVAYAVLDGRLVLDADPETVTEGGR